MKVKTGMRGFLASRNASIRRIGLFIAVAAMAGPFGALAQGSDKTGSQVVAAVCSKCHAGGANGAPKIGDKNAWNKLAEQGLTNLTAVALKGIREMPSHGGNPNLSSTEIARAITFMVNKSGGHWIEPTSKTKPSGPRTGEQIVKMQCSKCHQKGVDGAPKIGDTEAWIPRLKNGLDATVLSAANGHGAMPARGGLLNLSDAELRSAISYMFKRAQPPASKG